MEGSEMLREAEKMLKKEKVPVEKIKKLIIDEVNPIIIYWEGFDLGLLEDQKVVNFNQEIQVLIERKESIPHDKYEEMIIKQEEIVKGFEKDRI